MSAFKAASNLRRFAQAFFHYIAAKIIGGRSPASGSFSFEVLSHGLISVTLIIPIIWAAL
jgi:hypothetical protein